VAKGQFTIRELKLLKLCSIPSISGCYLSQAKKKSTGLGSLDERGKGLAEWVLDETPGIIKDRKVHSESGSHDRKSLRRKVREGFNIPEKNSRTGGQRADQSD